MRKGERGRGQLRRGIESAGRCRLRRGIESAGRCRLRRGIESAGRCQLRRGSLGPGASFNAGGASEFGLQNAFSRFPGWGSLHLGDPFNGKTPLGFSFRPFYLPA
ncbi:MAG: hypothetical protein NUV70_07830 [Caldiserica bacterium]|nr:hypothetical protein [Caldisericota bacterium]